MPAARQSPALVRLGPALSPGRSLSPPAAPPDPATLRGIALMAAEAAPVLNLNEVEYKAMAARSILNRCTAARMPFTWTVNPYRGCEFGCQYCYARYTHEFMELRDPAEFERRIFLKAGAADLLRRDLRRVRPGESIAIGTATDPYQPAERRHRVTRSLLEVLAGCTGLTLGIITKSDLIVRDAELLQRIASGNRLSVRLTITTTDTQLARLLEPRAPRPDLRLKAVSALRAAGLQVGVMAAPILPALTDSRASLEALIAAAAMAGAVFFNANALFLKPCAQAQFLPFLERHRPALVARYRTRYSENAYLSNDYRDRLHALVARLRARYGLRSGPDPAEAPDARRAVAVGEIAQMNLFG
jgi:DNA repair photolyase